MEKLMIQILKDEVKPATGCTEPVAVAYAAGYARNAFEAFKGTGLTAENTTMVAKVSPNLFKNGLGVGIPNCNFRGLNVSAALGLWACNPEDGLKVFENMTPESVNFAMAYMNENTVKLEVLDTVDKVHVVIELKSGSDTLELTLRGTHDHVERIVINGKETFSNDAASAQQGLDKSKFYDMKLTDMVAVIANLPVESIAFLNEGLVMNKKAAAAGLSHSMGMGVGYGLHQCIEEGILGDDLVNQAMSLTAAASDARMSGMNITIMSSNGSGNNGLTAILPLVAYFEKHAVSEADTLRALAMSHLINCYVKERIGRLSAMCSCAISAATGSGAAIAWLMSKDTTVVLNTIQNMTGNLAGMICDGAKEGCAMKLATGAATGVHAALLSSKGIVLPSANGIVGRTAEESIEHLGILSKQGMQLTDGVILDMMKSMI